MPKTWRDTDDPRQALRDLLAFSSRDWGQVKGDAWLWGIVFGWDGDEEGEGGAMDELASRHGWDEHDVARLQRLHENFKRLELGASHIPEIVGIPCGSGKPHPPHDWQMSATGYCRCQGHRPSDPSTKEA